MTYNLFAHKQEYKKVKKPDSADFEKEFLKALDQTV